MSFEEDIIQLVSSLGIDKAVEKIKMNNFLSQTDKEYRVSEEKLSALLQVKKNPEILARLIAALN